MRTGAACLHCVAEPGHLRSAQVGTPRCWVLRRVKWINAVIGVGERFQHRHSASRGHLGGEPEVQRRQVANLLVVALGWYGFTAIYPLLLIVVTVFGFIGKAALGESVIKTLAPVPDHR